MPQPIVYPDCSPHLYRAIESTVDAQSALYNYTRASVFDDAELPAKFIPRAAVIAPHRKPVQILHQLPAPALHHVVRRLVSRSRRVL